MKITISNKIRLQNPPQELKELLISILRVNNPKYIKALEYGKKGYGIDPHIYNFSVLPDESLLVPRGLRSNILEAAEKLGSKVEIVDQTTHFPPNFDIYSGGIKYRPYQARALNKLIKTREGLLVAPPGSGKTIMGISLLPLFGQPMLWLTHTDALAKQCIERVKKYLPSLSEDDIGIIGGGKWKIGNLFTVGMIQTIAKKPEQAFEIMNKFGIVVLDECLIEGTNITMLDGSIKDISTIQNGDITTFGEVSNKFERITKTITTLRGGWGTLSGTETHVLPFIPRSKLAINSRGELRPAEGSDVVYEQMANINKNDFLLVREDNCHTEKYIIGEKQSRLLALIACDGHIEKHLRCLQVGIVKDKEWFLNEMINDTSFVEEPEIKTSDCNRGDLIIRAYSEELISFVNKFVPEGKKETLLVPNIMEYASIEDIRNYLQVVFDTEGGLNKNQITITMSVPEFLIGIQHLLKKFGIISRIIPIKPKKVAGKPYSRLAMSGYDALLFWKKIGFSIERKQEELTGIIKNNTKFVRRVTYKGIKYRCMPVITSKTVEKETKVYDFTTKEHLFEANSVLSSNCHHCPANTFLKVVSSFNPYFMYGLTATPYRVDGLETLMYQALGTTETRVSLEEVETEGGIIVPTIVYKPVESRTIDGSNTQRLITDHIMSNKDRNAIITGDVLKEAISGNYCIVLCDRRDHCENLYDMISTSWEKTGIATGKYSKKYVEEQVARFNNNEITVLVCTFQLLGEGFDVDFLNRAFIASPFRSEQKAEQLIGRIQRTAPSKGKTDAIVYDYIDVNIGVFKSQFFSNTLDCRYNLYERLGARVIPYSEYEKRGK